jgi:signal transduction histidine kinase
VPREYLLDNERLRRLLEVGRDLVSELDLETVLQRMLGVARDLTGAQYAAVGILDEGRHELERFITSGIDAETHKAIGDLPRGRGVLGVLITDPKPLRLNNVADHPSSYGFPPGHPRMQAFLGVPIVIRGQSYGNLYLTQKDEGFTEADEQAVVILSDWAAVAIDNARLYERTQARRDELEKAISSFEATTEIARAVGGETDLDHVLELIVKRARALVEARTLVLLLKDADQLQVAATAGDAGKGLLGSGVSLHDSVAGSVLRTHEAERLTAQVEGRFRFSIAEAQLAQEAALFVPLVFRGQALGVLAAFDRANQKPDFDPEDERLLLSFAASAATAVATAQSVQAQRLRQSIEAAEKERRRWARELHDDTLQGLGALRVLLASIRRRAPDDGWESMLQDAVSHLTIEIDKLRGLITELRPAALDELGLAPAIETLAERTRSVEGISVSAQTHLPESKRLTPESESAIYRIVQEAFTNAAKHSRATHIELYVKEDAGSICIDVSDNGVGFDVSGAHAGFGLTGMRERAALLGGRLEVHSSSETGSHVRATLPATYTDSSQADRPNSQRHMRTG